MWGNTILFWKAFSRIPLKFNLKVKKKAHENPLGTDKEKTLN